MDEQSVLLAVELGPTTPQQRTIFRREILLRDWKIARDDGRVFLITKREMECELDAQFDEQALEQVTQQLHAALDAAQIVDWAADCMLDRTRPRNVQV